MKTLILFLLISAACFGQSDSLHISPTQVRNVYIGLRSAEQYRQKYADCLEVANSLNDIIQQANDDLHTLQEQTSTTDIVLQDLYAEQERAAVAIQKLKSKKTPWWRHPIT